MKTAFAGLAILALTVSAGTSAAQTPSATPRPTPAPTARPAARPAAKPAVKPTPAPTPTPTPEPTPEPTPAAPRRPQIAVLPFDFGTLQNQWWGTTDIGKGVADQIVDSLVNDGTYSVIERSKLDTVLAEQDFAQSVRANPDAAKLSQVGKVLGVRYLVAGSITQFATSDRKFGGGVAGSVAKGMLGPVGGLSFRKVKHQVKLTARLIDTTTGEVVVSAVGVGESKKGQGVGVEMSEGQGTGVAFSMTSSDYRQSGIGEAQEKATTSLVLAILEKKPESANP
jgi:curli biogenesis system outer membrane secretion channel CsgG